jgi:PAS domain-containing protein
MNDPKLPPLPAGAPTSAGIEGILDGRVGDADALQRAVAELGQSGAGPFRCDIQGGRFSLLPVDTQLPPGFDAAAQARFLDALQAVVAAAQPGSIETNLRSRMVYADQVAETLFRVRGASIEPLTRLRPRTAADAPALPTRSQAAAASSEVACSLCAASACGVGG